MSQQSESAIHSPSRPRCERDAAKCLTMCPKACLTSCPTHSFTLEHGNCIAFDQEKCIGCGKCVDKCPGGALSIDGHSNPNAIQAENAVPQQRMSLKKRVLAKRREAKKETDA